MSIAESEKIITFSKNLKSFRESKNLSTYEFAKIIKISVSSLKNYEYMKMFPPYERLFTIADYFGVSIDYLILGEKTNFIKHTDFVNHAHRLDGMWQEASKILNYIDEFLDLRKKSNNIYDEYPHKLKNNFNDNFSLIVEKSNYIGRELAEKTGISERQITSYKHGTEPPYKILFRISSFFKISMHALITGQKLQFDFENKGFKEVILKADEHLSIEHIEMTIKYIKQILKNNNIKMPA